jgi:predicted nucleic acid-binding protein
MPEVVISDTSCLILLTKIKEIHLLNSCYERVAVTREVALEFGFDLPAWIEVRDVQDKSMQRSFDQLVDSGEASSFALAMEIADCLLIVDDRKARKLAKSMGLRVAGTLGVLVKAKERGLISSIKPIIAKLAETDFRISDRLINTILDITGEK